MSCSLYAPENGFIKAELELYGFGIISKPDYLGRCAKKTIKLAITNIWWFIIGVIFTIGNEKKIQPKAS